eukprot:3292674-Amphidinium_carterae.1
MPQAMPHEELKHRSKLNNCMLEGSKTILATLFSNSPNGLPIITAAEAVPHKHTWKPPQTNRNV